MLQQTTDGMYHYKKDGSYVLNLQKDTDSEPHKTN